jgi:hypothetical protein
VDLTLLSGAGGVSNERFGSCARDSISLQAPCPSAFTASTLGWVCWKRRCMNLTTEIGRESGQVRQQLTRLQTQMADKTERLPRAIAGAGGS